MQSVLLKFPAVSESEDMALSKPDKEWIQEQIIEAIKGHGWGKVLIQFKSWSPAGAMVAILLFAALQWQKSTEFRIHTEDRLDRLEATLRESRAAQAPSAVLKEIASLNQKQFVKSLPALRKVEEQPVSQVKPNRELLRDISTKLMEVNEQAPEYWATVLQFIRFASAGLSPDVPPPGEPTLIIKDSRPGIRFSDPVSHAIVLLDNSEVANIRFEHSRIIFTERPTRMNNVTFVDCVFELPVLDNPNKYLQNTGRILLASNLNSVFIGSL